MKKNYTYQFIFSLGLIVFLFAPSFEINGVAKNLIECVFTTNNLTFIFVGLGLILPMVALNVLTYFNKFINLKFYLSLVGLILTAFTFIIFEKAASEYEVSHLMGFLIILFLYIGCTIVFITKFFENNRIFITDIVEIAVFVAIAIILDLPFLKLKVVANGGSISLVMLPLIFISLRKGPIKGFLACGILYGLITCLTDGYGFATYPFDYLLGFGSCAIVGFFKKPITTVKKPFIRYSFFFVGCLLAFALRLAASTVSGMLIYSLDFVGSLAYNATYLGPSMIGCMILGIFLLPIFLQIMKKYKHE